MRDSMNKLIMSAIAAGIVVLMSGTAFAHCGVCGIEGKKGSKKGVTGCIKKTALEGQLCIVCVSKSMRLTKQQKDALTEAFHKYNDAVIKAKEVLVEAANANLQTAQAARFQKGILGKKAAQKKK